MSGHSKWASIKHKKGAADAKRGKVFSKLIREITVAARSGGGDPGGNPRLRTVLDKARAANMPHDNVTRAIKRGTGELEGVAYEEVMLEGYGPGGTAVLVELLTDNRNRTVSEIRHIFTRQSGNLGEVGCVGWMFTKRGVLTFPLSVGEDALMECALDAGALDIQQDDLAFTVTTAPETLEQVKQACIAKKLVPTEASITMFPSSTVKIEGSDAERMLKLLEGLEDHDDVQNVYANFDIDTKTMEKLAS
ncbi:MAG: YebC/PmpR family DNA-binding transcriptional regulator [Deltaproteobacteria bacterium]|nr:YebC/PmpR family DNA-binding transcriptional regulator [Deltaproteobacteria bacterium]